MSIEIATLAIEVNSESVPTATAQVQKLGTAAKETEANTASLTKRQDAFLQSLDRQAATMGNGAAQMRAYKAEQLGLADDKTFLNLNQQIKDLESSGPSSLDRMATRIEGRMGQMALRMGVHMALVGGIIGGVSAAFEFLSGGMEKLVEANSKMADALAKSAASAGDYADQMRKEQAQLNTGNLTVNEAGNAHSRFRIAKEELMALGPEYRDALDKETGSLRSQLDIVTKLMEASKIKMQDELKLTEDNHKSVVSVRSLGTGGYQENVNQDGFGYDEAAQFVMGSKAVQDSFRAGDMENDLAYREKWIAQSKAIAEVDKSLAKLRGEYDRPNSSGSVDTTTQYGREVQRLQEQLVSLTMSARDAEEMKLRLMDNGAGGDVSKGMQVWDQVKAMEALGVSEKERSKQGAQVMDEMLQLHEKYELIGADLATQLQYKMMDKGMTDFEISQMVELTQAIQDKTDALAKSNSLQSEANRLNKPAGDERQRIEEMYSRGLIGADVYTAQLQKLQKSELQLKANGGDLWAGMALQVEGFSTRATDAFVNFTTGASGGWRDMVTSMIKDMERFIVQQQLMGPLFASFGGWVAGLGASGFTGNDGGQWVQMGGETGYTPYPTGTVAAPPASSSDISSSIVVNVNPGAAESASKATSGGTDMARQIENAVNAVLIKNQRSGGILAPGGR